MPGSQASSGLPSRSPSPAESIAALPHPSSAPIQQIPRRPYFSLEYPGPVSRPTAILDFCPQQDIDECFNAAPTPAGGPSLELNYRPGQYTSHPVRGMRVTTQRLLLKIRRRRRRAMESDEDTVARARSGSGQQEKGAYSAEMVGTIGQVVRFRSLADYSYTPNPDGRIAQVLTSLKELDYDAILNYEVSPFTEDNTGPVIDAEGNFSMDPSALRSLLDLQPPPIFVERNMPGFYNFRNAPQAVIEDHVDLYTGEIRKRYVNKARFVGAPPTKIGHNHAPGEVPTGPPKPLAERIKKADQKIYNRLVELFAERPIWMRHSILAQFSEDDVRIITAAKIYLPSVSYTIGAGPYWKCLIRYGYDPVADPSAYIYQRIWFYIQVEKRAGFGLRNEESGDEDEEVLDAKSKRSHTWWEQEQERLIAEGKRGPVDRSRNYFFDGKELHRDRPDYQLTDITDPLIAKYIHDPENLKDTCDPRDGWYKAGTLDLIKAMTRKKFMHIRESGKAAPDTICYHIIEEYNRGTLVFDGNEADEAADGEEGGDGSRGGTPASGAAQGKRKSTGSKRGGKGSKGLMRWARETEGLNGDATSSLSARAMVAAEDAPAEPKKRGRPRKKPVDEEPKVPKKRGRPKKVVPGAETAPPPEALADAQAAAGNVVDHAEDGEEVDELASDDEPGPGASGSRGGDERGRGGKADVVIRATKVEPDTEERAGQAGRNVQERESGEHERELSASPPLRSIYDPPPRRGRR